MHFLSNSKKKTRLTLLTVAVMGAMIGVGSQKRRYFKMNKKLLTVMASALMFVGIGSVTANTSTQKANIFIHIVPSRSGVRIFVPMEFYRIFSSII